MGGNARSLQDRLPARPAANAPGSAVLRSPGSERIDLERDSGRTAYPESDRMTDQVPTRGPRPGHAFAHASEAEFARILDFYEVSWAYEPHVFPILWDLEGNVLESFAPDFYLPDLDTFVELTTLQQRLVRKKNRKVRRLRELYPGLRIKLFYARDFRALMLKYGRSALVSELSGTLGQVGGRLDEVANNATPVGSVHRVGESATEAVGTGLASGEQGAGERVRAEHRSRAARRRVRRAEARADSQPSVS